MKALWGFWKTKAFWLAAGCGLTTALLLASLAMGASRIPLGDIFKVLARPEAGSHAYAILYLIRLPRTLACVLCGGALAVSGLLIQTVLHTPLASPGIIGVNSGAGFAVVLAAFVFPAAFLPRIFAAFVGALAAVLLVYAIAAKTGASRLTIVLAGVAVSSLLSAFSDALITINPGAVIDRAAFAIGGFSGVGPGQVLPQAPLVACAVIAALALARQMEIMTMGDEVAASLGVRVRAVRFGALLLAALLAACAVSIGGLIGFVGLIAPHMARMLFKASFRRLVGFSFWFGSMLMLACDLLARVLFRPFEVPTGIVLAFVGAPFFLFLLLGRRRERV